MITATVETQNALREKVAKLRGKGQHFWSKAPGDVPCIGFIPQCQFCCIMSDENGANDLCIMAEIPDYPYDLNACTELWDFLADRGWTCQLANGLDKTWECTFETGTSGHRDFKQHYVPADTLEMAVCLAFAAAMEPT